MSIESQCRKLLHEFRSRPTLRAGSLITTVFGDAIAPRGGTVWLGSLIRVMEDFGVNERLVRTSVYRLVGDGWLRADQVGRRAYYTLTDEGRERFVQATHRIYGEPVRHWDGEWCLLLLSALTTADKDLVRRECGWLGFGALSPNVLAHPSPDMADLDVTVRRLGVGAELVVLSARTIRNEDRMRLLSRDCWNLDALAVQYGDFNRRFRPMLRALRGNSRLDERSAFQVRTLLVHEYRKILLRDPLLPPRLLPARWQGAVAYQLCRDLYRAVHAGADAWLDSCMETADGPLPPPSPDYFERFGGLAGTDDEHGGAAAHG